MMYLTIIGGWTIIYTKIQRSLAYTTLLSNYIILESSNCVGKN